MDFGMWRRLLLILFLVWNGLGASGNNQEIFKQLCHIAGNVSVLMGKNGEAKIHLKEALYGKDRMASFDNSGTFTGGSECGLGLHHRSQYCSHIEGGGPHFFGSGKHGCFGHSLLGTLLCICVPWQRDQKDLCGLRDNVIDKGVWTSGVGDHEKKKFQAVWDEVKEKCIKKNTTIADTSGQLGDLESAVKYIKEETKNNVISGNKGYYLGGGSTTNGHCSRNQPQPGCVTYPAKSGNEPHIPWVDKILTAISTSRTQQHTNPKNAATASGAAHHHDDTEDLSDPDPGGEQEGEEEEGDEDSAPNPDPQDPAKPLRSRRKRRDTSKQSTEHHAEPVTAIFHKYDVTILTQPFWLLSAVFIF